LQDAPISNGVSSVFFIWAYRKLVANVRYLNFCSPSLFDQNLFKQTFHGLRRFNFHRKPYVKTPSIFKISRRQAYSTLPMHIRRETLSILQLLNAPMRGLLTLPTFANSYYHTGAHVPTRYGTWIWPRKSRLAQTKPNIDPTTIAKGSFGYQNQTQL
jgi:hypothetical protein